MKYGFVKAESTNLLRIDALILTNFFAANPDFFSAEFRNVKTCLCVSPCNQVCPPCFNRCPVKCPHSPHIRCGNLCGAPCSPCQEKCMRGCEHSKCLKRCGEKCSRAACSERCPKQLSCGHPCRGLCGEPCPDVCAVCRPHSVPQNLNLAPYEDDDIGDSDSDHERQLDIAWRTYWSQMQDDSLIKLEDCPHVFSVEEMDTLVRSSNEDNLINIPACPLCRVPIINTYRYKDLINDIIKNEINPVKRKVYGDKGKIDETRFILLDKIDTLMQQDLPDDLKEPFMQLATKSREDKRSTLLCQETYLMKLNIIEIMNKLLKECMRQIVTDVRNYIKPICRILQDETSKLSEQRQMDINRELKRINAMIHFAKLVNGEIYKAMKTQPGIVAATEEARRCLHKYGVFDEKESLEALRSIHDSQEYVKMEMELVVRAMGTKMGHWYKCPNGHPYYIGECGGATQVSKCIECGVPVGGINHQLLAGNAHAGEVDGSSFAAWSEQANNMNNFDLNDI